ncbi:small ribosomal subunit protein mS78 (rPPR3a)-like [Aristolochia californica]|uniref:small ribosomal subunit protein mS78 (rPPR3a)-like n=1 Tax=Aristolochia californica TaxID=171875 RepID=UPI0035DAC6FF
MRAFAPSSYLLRNANRLFSVFVSSRSSSSGGSSSSTVVSKMVNDILKERDLDQVVKKFLTNSEMYRFRCKHRVYEVTFRRLAAAQRVSSIEQIIDAHKKYPDITSEGFAVRLIALCGKSHMFDRARKLFDELVQLNCPRTVMSLNALLSAAIDSGLHGKVPELFQQLSSELSISPDNITYNILILAYSKMGSLDEALSLLKTMEAKGVEPAVITFNTLLHGFYRADRFSDAEKLWAKMEERNISPDVVTFNEKMQALATEGKTADVLQLIDEMRSRGLKPDIFSFNSLIKAYCSDGNIEEAKRVFADLTTNECAPNWRTFETMIPYLCEEGELGLAFKLAKDSIRQRCRVNSEVLQQVVDGFMKASRREDAEKLVEVASKSKDSDKYNLKLPPEEEKCD